MKKQCVTVSGLPGSGTTTISKMLSRKTGLKVYSSGKAFRTVASKMGLTLGELTELSEKEKRIDQEIDEAALRIIKDGNYIIEGRLAGWLSYEQNITSLKIWIKAEERIRHERIVSRDENEKDKEMIVKREKSELGRYRKYYGFDLESTDIYDLVFDSSILKPEEIIGAILKEYD